MTGYTFKTYISEGREHFLFGEQENSGYTEIKKDFPFPESLLDILYLDTQELRPLFRRFGEDLREYHSTFDKTYLDDVLTILDQLAERHIYFAFLRLQWNYRIGKALRLGRISNPEAVLPMGIAEHTAVELQGVQSCIQQVFAEVLDVDSSKEPALKKLAACYRLYGEESWENYRFRTLSTRFELVEGDTFAEVLYPNDIFDLIDYALRECVRQETRMRVCKNCGRWFAITGRSSAEYCDRIVDARGRTCKDVGSIAQWTRKRSGDEIFKVYRREYKKRFAWIRAGRITQEEFYAWSERARREKQRCDDGKITLEEFAEWLANS